MGNKGTYIINTLSNRIILLLISIFLVSCLQKKKKNIEDIKNTKIIYNIVDSVWNSNSRFSKKNISTMKRFYLNKKVNMLIDKNAYSGLSTYFNALFLNNDRKFYDFLSKEKDSLIIKRIKEKIKQEFEIQKDISNSNRYKDSIYLRHKTNNLKFKKYVDYIFM